MRGSYNEKLEKVWLDYKEIVCQYNFLEELKEIKDLEK